jgi:hypothetical protein
MSYASVTHDDFTVETNTADDAQLRTNLGAPAADAVSQKADTAVDAKADDTPTPDATAGTEDDDADDDQVDQPGRERNADGTFKAKDAKAATDAKDAKDAKDPKQAKDAKDAGDKPAAKATKKDPEARIAHVTWEREEARRETARERARREELERENAELRAGRTPAKPEPTRDARPAASSDPSDPEPQEKDFDDYGAFIRAQARWDARQEFQQQQRQADERRRAEQREHHTRQRFSAYSERIDKAVAADPDFLNSLSADVLALKPLSALEPGERPGPLNALAEEIIDSEHSDQLLRHFSEHPDDLRRFAALHPRQLLREFARLEARLTTAPAGSVAPPPLSQAKPPVRPVTGSPRASDDAAPEDDSDFDAHARYWNAKDRAARRR